MNTSEIREQLHKYINKADDKHLEAIYILLEHEINAGQEYDDATITMLHERREYYLKGEKKTYTPEESLELISHHPIS